MTRTRAAINSLLAVALGLALSAGCRADDYAGCYELKLSAWTPPFDPGEVATAFAPPQRIELTTTPQRTLNENGLAVTPARGAKPSIHRLSFWTREGSHIHIVWTTGYSGLKMDLEASGANLVGTATAFWDFPAPKQTSHVIATRISCE